MEINFRDVKMGGYKNPRDACVIKCDGGTLNITIEKTISGWWGIYLEYNFVLKILLKEERNLEDAKKTVKELLELGIEKNYIDKSWEKVKYNGSESCLTVSELPIGKWRVDYYGIVELITKDTKEEAKKFCESLFELGIGRNYFNEMSGRKK